jgi:NADH-quinone oxidoreductase subunit A
VATLVVVLSVWMVFFQPWAVVFRTLGLPGFLAIGFFALPLVVGLAYEWRRGGLDG